MESLIWESTELSMKEFVEHFVPIPAIFITRSGYSGYDEDIHQIGSGEVYWVYEIQRQKRIVARCEHISSYISIPVEYPLKVQVIKDDDQVSPSISIMEAADLLVEASDPIRIQFEDNQSVSFQVGADQGNTMRFGNLQVEESYEEKYLLAYTMHGGNICSTTVGIPVYLDITVSIAKGLRERDEQSFNHWMNQVKEITSRLKITPVKMCREIIMFNERPSSGEYEYMQPSLLASLLDSTESDKPSAPGNSSKGGNKQNDYIIHSANPKARVKQTPRTTRSKDCSIALPPLPRRPPPSVPAKYQKEATSQSQIPPSPPPDGKPPPTPERRPTPMKTQVKCSAAGQPIPSTPKTSVEAAPHLPSTYENLNSPDESPSHYYDTVDTIDCVPTDFDIATLSIEQVTKQLKILNLERYCDIFKSRQIDGALLLQLDETIFVEEFGFSRFDARKLETFLKDGWRPKLK